jgi:hypothetical protein
MDNQRDFLWFFFSPAREKNNSVYHQHHQQHNNNYISDTSETKFLGLIIDDTLSWKQHIDQLIKKNVCSMLCLEVCKLFIINGDTKNNLFCSHSHYYELWCNLLGQLLLCQKGIYISKQNHQNHY